MYIPQESAHESKINLSLPLSQDIVQEEGTVQVSIEVMETAFRRKIMTGVSEIGRALEASALEDKVDIFEELKLLQEEFMAVMKTPHVNEELAHASFIQHLNNILVDPLTLEPLEEDAVVGSDGQVYDRISLCIYLSSLPKEMRGRSPLDPKNPKTFFTYEHPALKKMVEWLKKNEVSRPRSQALLKKYQELKNQKLKAKIPTKQTEKEKKIFARALQIKQRQDELKRKKVMGCIAGEEKVQRQFAAAHSKNPHERLAILEEKAAQIEKKLQDQPIEELYQFWQELRNENEKKLDQALLLPEDELEEAQKDFLAFEASLHQRKAKLHERITQLNEQFETLTIETKASLQSQFGDPASERSALSNEDLSELRQKETSREKHREEQIEAFNQRLAALEANNREQFQKFDLMSREINEDIKNNDLILENMGSKDKIRHRELKKEIEVLNSELHQVELADTQIKQKLTVINQQIREQQLANERLQLANERIKKSIRKKRNGWKDALKAVVSAIVSLGASAGGQKATGAQGSVQATPNSAKVNVKYEM